MPYRPQSFLRELAAGLCATARGKIAGILILTASLTGCVSVNMPTMTDNLPTADQPRGVVYLSISDFCKTTTLVSADIRLAYQDKGAHQLSLSGAGISPGYYFIRITSHSQSRMVSAVKI